MQTILSFLKQLSILLLIGGAAIFIAPRLLSMGNIRSGWDTNFDLHSVPMEEIISGGVQRDGIPPIDRPQFDPVAGATDWLQPQSPVIAFELNGDARAYPLGILTRHEIVNDEVGGTPVAVTFCPLCNSAVVFDRTVDGDVLRLGVSGMLRHSDLIMWDDRTESWWQQFTGEAIVGDMTGTQLTMLPSLVIGFGEFADRYPEGQVLSGGGGFRSGNATRNPYVGYDSNPNPFLFQGSPDQRLFPTERVLAGVIGGESRAYPYPLLAETRVINDTLGDKPIVALWQPGAASALDQSDIDASRDVGMAALYSRVVDGQTLTFALTESGSLHDAQTGSTWNIFGEATAGSLAGTTLQQQLAFPHFWFAWAAFQPETSIYGE